jgi:inhibitor of KinA sporulation pathway (predicted exonuclease)
MTDKKKVAAETAPPDISRMDQAVKDLMEKMNEHLNRRPSGEYLPEYVWNDFMCVINLMKECFDWYIVQLRPGDRRRLNGVGIKGQGFVHRCYDSALENQQLLPRTLGIEQFGEDEQDFNRKRMLYEALTEFQKEAWNATLTAADVVYGDALEYYNSVREAAKRRVPGAEDAFNFLRPFFARRTSRRTEPTEKELLRDFKAVLHGKKDGMVEALNEKPKRTGGEHKVIDDTHHDKMAYRDDKSAEIVE